MKVLGVCGGQGVILHPFKKSLIGNIEPRKVFYSKNNPQWVKNFEEIPYIKDIDKVFLNIDRGDVDIIIGAPDCGHSSVLAYSRAKKLSNPRDNDSLSLFIQAVKVFNPKVFLMENLTKILDQITKEDFNKTFQGYQLLFHSISVKELGNSQVNRKRLLIIGINKANFGDNLSKAQYQLSNLYKVNTIKTSGELIKGLRKENIDIGNVRENINTKITLYAGFKCFLSDIKDYWESNPNQKRYLVTGRKFTTAPGVYRNTRDCFPATARKANRQFNHWGLQMTPRELARIQGVPDEFILHMDESDIQYWINKARVAVTKTPPYEVGLWFKNQIREVKKLWT